MNFCFYSVLRHADGSDYTNHGLSSRVTDARLFWNCTPAKAINYCVANDIPAYNQFILASRDLWGEDHSYAEPLVKPNGHEAAQSFGGNFLYTSNGLGYKFKGEKTGRPIPIHDRFEDWETFQKMSI